MLNFGEHSSDSGTLSWATENNPIEVKVLLITFSITNRGKANIIGRNREKNLYRLKTKIYRI